MTHSLNELVKITQGQLVGDGDSQVTGVCSIDQLKANKISYLGNQSLCKKIINTENQFYIIKPEWEKFITNGIIHEDPAKAFRLIAEVVSKKDQKSGIESTAIIAETAKIGDQVYIGHYSVIGDNTIIENNVKIKAHTIIGDNCQIGLGTQIDNSVIIDDDTIIGKNCHFYNGALIGGEGFGYNFEGGTWKHIPQLGKVIIGDFVEVGCNSCIDRGAINDTIIGNNVIIDNMVQIGHNVQIGNSSAMAAFVGIAGSTKIGNYCMIGGKVGVNGHIEIKDNIQINAGSNIIKSITEPGSYSGVLPTLPSRKWNRIIIYLQRIEDLFKKRKK